jgi:hypothetical protein
MSKRWFAGVLLFALGFGSAFLVRLGSAEAQPTSSGEVETGLRYTVGNGFTLANTGNKAYLAVVTSTGGAGPQILQKSGTAEFSKKDTVNIYRLVPVGIWATKFRPCHEWELCPAPSPEPPPPPPLRLSALFLKPRDLAGRPGTVPRPPQ